MLYFKFGHRCRKHDRSFVFKEGNYTLSAYKNVKKKGFYSLYINHNGRPFFDYEDFKYENCIEVGTEGVRSNVDSFFAWAKKRKD